MASQREKRDSRLELIERLFAGTGTTYDFMVNAATFGIDRLWKRRIAELERELSTLQARAPEARSIGERVERKDGAPVVLALSAPAP